MTSYLADFASLERLADKNHTHLEQLAKQNPSICSNSFYKNDNPSPTIPAINEGASTSNDSENAAINTHNSSSFDFDETWRSDSSEPGANPVGDISVTEPTNRHKAPNVHYRTNKGSKEQAPRVQNDTR